MSTNKKRSRRQPPKPEARSPKPPEAPPAAPDSPTVGTLPDLGNPAQSDDTVQPETPDEALPTLNGDTPPGEGKQRTITIEIPIGPLSTTGYITGHVEVNHLSTAQKYGLNRVWNGLRDSRATLQDRNREVDNPPDAVRWLLELIAEAVGE